MNKTELVNSIAQSAELTKADAKKALEGTDTEAIKAATDELQKKFYEVSTKMYQAANPQGTQGEPQGDPNAAGGAYDGDYTVVDDDNK